MVKELMENSLDAGANRVEVSVSGGGFESVTVADDGCGMEEEDLRLAFERYATSKIACREDLGAISTLGFRGEALAAIAAVADVTVLTRTAEDDVGLRGTVKQGRVAVRREGAPRGTTVTVRRLFADVPARRKFAGAAAAEYRRVADVFKRICLSAPLPAFKLTKDGKLQYTARAGATRRERVGEVIGWQYLEEVGYAEASEGDCKLTAFFSSPRVSFAGTANIYTIINGRPARAKPVFKAVMSAYDLRLDRGRYPLAVIYLDLPPDAVDVNVHPRKEEVRLADEEAVAAFVRRALAEGLGRAAVTVPNAAFAAEAPVPPPPPVVVTNGIREAVEGYLKRTGLWPQRPAHSSPAGRVEEVTPPPVPPAGDVAVLGQLDATYIIVKKGEELVVIDQHTAHERVIYDSLASRPAAVQELLLPLSFSLPPALADDLTAGLPALRDAGFDIAEFGPQTFVVRSVPNGARIGDWEGFFSEVASNLRRAGGERSAPGAAREAVLKTIACHGAVKAGEVLTAEEMASLVRDLWATPTPEVCPHGRPTMVRLETKQLERLFRR